MQVQKFCHVNTVFKNYVQNKLFSDCYIYTERLSTDGPDIPAEIRCSPNVVIVLFHRPQRWPNIKRSWVHVYCVK